MKQSIIESLPHGNLIGWLWTYKAATPQVQMGVEPTVRLDIDNEPQPDGVLLISQESGGKSTLSADGYLEGSPELVVEIAASSAAIDLGDKNGNMQQVLATLQTGINSAEHQEFVQQLIAPQAGEGK